MSKLKAFGFTNLQNLIYYKRVGSRIPLFGLSNAHAFIADIQTLASKPKIAR